MRLLFGSFRCLFVCLRCEYNRTLVHNITNKPGKQQNYKNKYKNNYKNKYKTITQRLKNRTQQIQKLKSSKSEAQKHTHQSNKQGFTEATINNIKGKTNPACIETQHINSKHTTIKKHPTSIHRTINQPSKHSQKQTRLRQ